MKINQYTNKGTKATKQATVSDMVFDQQWNADLVHQVVVAQQSNARQGSAHTKDRSEVSGGGKKPWRQKGTGRARHGSTRSPLWRTGGVTFGPRNERNYDKKVNQKMKIKALYAALSAKLRDTRILPVESFDVKDISTKSAQEILTNLAKVEGFETLNTKKNPKNILVILPEYSDDMFRSLRNIPHVNVSNALELNTLDVMNHRYMVVVNPEKVNEVLESRHHTKATVVPSAAAVTAETSA